MRALIEIDLSLVPEGKDVAVYIPKKYIYDDWFPTYPIDGYKPLFQLGNGRKIVKHKDDGFDYFMEFRNGKGYHYSTYIYESENGEAYWEVKNR